MTHACEAVKTRHKETSLIFPVLALVVLFLWGSSQSLPVVIGINILALIGTLPQYRSSLVIPLQRIEPWLQRAGIGV
ncbi:hypothetical protein MJH56_17690, partial [Salmonella enterica subsp. enterica serovar Kentucky]|nr:hypothetical protein [Salmonella enterica subsp. enterica serovar Kentucky]